MPTKNNYKNIVVENMVLKNMKIKKYCNQIAHKKILQSK